MFKATVVASKLREQMAHYFEMVTGDNVVQILHKGGEVKVLMTQEHYMNLLSRLSLHEKFDKQESVAPKSVDEIAEMVLSKMKDFESEKVLTDGDSKVEQNSGRYSYRMGR